MRLEIDSVNIQGIKEATETNFSNDGMLSINLDELKVAILQDPRIKSVEIDIVHPEENVRILNVQDVVQPRCKIDKENADFPLFINKMCTAGDGKTLSLKNCAVVVCNPCTNRIESGVLDMAGEGALLSPYSKMHNVCIAPYIAEEVLERDFENAVQNAGFKTAVYLANAAKTSKPDETEIFESEIGISNNPDLPNIAVYWQMYTPQFDYLAVSDPLIYGSQISYMLPTIIHPNEVLDGGTVGWHAMKAIDTYSTQNHGVVKELYKHHGKDLNLVGVVIAPANIEFDSRMRCAYMSASLIKNTLHADAAILVKCLGGMPHADISATGVALEDLGVKTAVTTTPLTATGTLADTALFNDECLDLILLTGAPFERTTKIHFKAEKFIGGTAKTKLYSPNPEPQYAEDEVIGLEQYLIPGCHDHTGGQNIIVEEF